MTSSLSLMFDVNIYKETDVCVLLGYILLILPYVVQGNILKFNHIVILKHYQVWSYASQ